MNRRSFLKKTLAGVALAPVSPLLAGLGPDGDKRPDLRRGAQVSRRAYRGTGMTLPMLGFGLMRLPRVAPDRPEIDYVQLKRFIERALEAGVNYFDTAYFYHGGLSEVAVGEVLSQFPRDSYYLADKMPISKLRTEEDVERIWNEQLARTKAGYFDFYLLHALNRDLWQRANDFHVYEFLKQKQAEGKIRKLGFSFHDAPEVLEEICRARPWDFAMIQLNYLDWTHYKSKEQYEILTRHDIPVVVMEPLRGGALANLPQDAGAIFTNTDPTVSHASWAFRYVGSLPNVICILSGMAQLEHLEDNIKTFADFRPLTEADQKVVATVLDTYLKKGTIPCTDCQYCMPCAADVNIPGIFALYNRTKDKGLEHLRAEYARLPEEERAEACVDCDACNRKCPQQLNIPDLLKRIQAELNP